MVGVSHYHYFFMLIQAGTLNLVIMRSGHGSELLTHSTDNYVSNVTLESYYMSDNEIKKRLLYLIITFFLINYKLFYNQCLRALHINDNFYIFFTIKNNC